MFVLSYVFLKQFKVDIYIFGLIPGISDREPTANVSLNFKILYRVFTFLLE